MIDTIETTSTVRIYVACLAAYNSGRLHGEWIDCDGKDESDIWNEINAMLAQSPEPNVQRQKCGDCGHYQDSREDDSCDHCGGELSAPFASAEEWAIHDYESPIALSEYQDIATIAELAEFAGNASEYELIGLAYLVDDCGRNIGDAIDSASDVCISEGSLVDYAAELVSDCYELPEIAERYFDYDSFARDLVLGGDVAEFTHDGARYLITNASEF